MTSLEHRSSLGSPLPAGAPRQQLFVEEPPPAWRLLGLDIWRLFLYQARTTMRSPIWYLFAILQPIMWLFLFGQLFHVMSTLPSFETESYSRYIAPGLAIMSTLMSSAFAGLGLLELIQNGAMDRYLTTPVSRAALLGGRVMHAAVLVVTQCLAVLVAAVLVGAGLPKSLAGFLLLIMAAVILGAGCSAASTALAMTLRQAQTLTAVLNFCILPIYFTSTLFMTKDLMPVWIQRLADSNPLNWAVTIARHGFEGKPPTEVMTELLLLIVFAVVCWILSLRLFGRYRAAL